MMRAASLGAVVVAVMLAAAGGVAGQSDSRRELARELARLAADDAARQRLDEQVRGSLVRAVATPLQQRLNRRLLDVEWKMLGDIVERFVRETLPPGRIEDIAVDVYLRHFDEAELRELLAFQRSAVGRKLARLSPALAAETARALDAEIRSSPAMPELLAELRRAFPVLGAVESP